MDPLSIKGGIDVIKSGLGIAGGSEEAKKVVDAAKSEVKGLFVIRPPESKNWIVYRHPNTNIRFGTQITVDEDDVAVFFREGKVYGTLKPGRNTLATTNIPFLGKLVDKITGGRMLKAEIFFVSTREFTNLSFGGVVGEVKDPESELAVGVRVYGTYSLKVKNPVLLITELVGKKGFVSNEEVTTWMGEQILKSMKDFVGKLIVKKKWPLLEVISGAYTSEIETVSLQRVKQDVSSYGIVIPRLGNFTLNMKEEDEKSLKEFRKDFAYTKMAGGFGKYAEGKMMIGAGKGMGKGGGGEGGGAGTALSGAGLGIGLGAGLSVFDKMRGRGGEATVKVRCASCGTLATENAKFCPSCGKNLLPTGRKASRRKTGKSRKKATKKPSKKRKKKSAAKK